MTKSLAARVASAAARPLLMRPEAAAALLEQIEAANPSVLRSPRRLSAFHRARLAAAAITRQAFSDEDADAQHVAPIPPGGEAYAPHWLGEPDEELDWGMSLAEGIAILRVDTPIDAQGEEWCGAWFHGYDTISAALTQAFADDRVKGVLLSMDSPGGVVDAGLYSTAELIRTNREQAGGKPVWVHADMACSAAYWIAAQADRIIAPRTGLVGSIGAVMLHAEYSGMLEKDGVKLTPITFGKRKVDFNDFEPLSETGRAKLQSMIDQTGRDFVAAVEAGRPVLTADALIATEADVFEAFNDADAESGLALGFVDEIAETTGLPAEASTFEALCDHLAAREITAGIIGGPAPASAAQSTTPERTQTMGRHLKMKAARAAAVAALNDPAINTTTAFAIVRAQARGAGITDEELDGEMKDEESTEDDPKMDADGNPIEEESEEDEPKTDADGNPIEEDAEEDEPKTDADGNPIDEEAEEDKNLPSAKTSKAILALPEAKGRTALAQKLAFMPGMTAANAKAALAASPKASGRTPTDAGLSTDARAGRSDDVESAAARAVSLIGQ